MPEEIRPSDGGLENPSVRYERTDASLRWVAGIIIAAIVSFVLVYCVVKMLFAGFRDNLAETRKSQFPLAPVPSPGLPPLPPEPRLEQIDRRAEISTSNVQVRQQAKLDILHSYGAAKEAGFIHIPIDRALTLLANTLPARSEAGAVAGMAAVRTVGLLCSSGPGPLSAASALFPGREQAERSALAWRQNGLVDSGESNSGRMFNRRKPSWHGR